MKKNIKLLAVAIVIISALLIASAFIPETLTHGVRINTVDKSCTVDSDCEIKATECYDCFYDATRDAVNKNWILICSPGLHLTSIISGFACPAAFHSDKENSAACENGTCIMINWYTAALR